MALLLPHSIFIHIPKTGGVWVRSAVRAAGIAGTELGCTWHDGLDSPVSLHKGAYHQSHHICFHNKLRDIDAQNRFTFSFVRHPFTLYDSYWRYKMAQGWDELSTVDKALRADTLEQFIKNAQAFDPGGWVSHMYRQFLDSDNDTVQFVGRTENLLEDTILALSIAGETFHEQKIRDVPPQNVSPKSAQEFPMELIERVYDMEKYAYDRFGYEKIPPGISIQGINEIKELKETKEIFAHA